jgi:hypothetical protein
MSLGAERNVRRSWIFRFQRKGQRVRDMGLGSTHDVGLAEARGEALRADSQENLVGGEAPSTTTAASCCWTRDSTFSLPGHGLK